LPFNVGCIYTLLYLFTGFVDVFGALRSSCLYRQHPNPLQNFCSGVQCWPGIKQQTRLFLISVVSF